MDDAPLIYSILEGLLRKKETVRVNLQARMHQQSDRAEGILVGLELRDELRDIRGILSSKWVRVHYYALGIANLYNLEFRLSEIENCSSLERTDIGWLLTINRETP